MICKIRLISIIASITVLTSLCACAKTEPADSYPKENAGGSGYGAGIKSSLYIEDFYFINVGTLKSTVELTLGSPHYTEEGNSSYTLYELNNGDSIEFAYDKEKSTVNTASYIFANGDKESFFDILVQLGVLKSSDSEQGASNVQIPSSDGNGKTDTETDAPSNSDKPIQQPSYPSQVVQGELFATGMYNYVLIEPVLTVGASRSSILSAVGKPNYYFSYDFSFDSYIIDCYNLNDGSKLYIDYGYARDAVRAAAIYKNGSYTAILGSRWSAQVKPTGFTRAVGQKDSLNRLKKNMTPAQAYKILGEPSWYEGNRGSYSDVFALPGGEYAYLSFGSAHNKLTSVSIVGEDGTSTVVTLN